VAARAKYQTYACGTQIKKLMQPGLTLDKDAVKSIISRSVAKKIASLTNI